jgi:hypothetical protein
MKRTSSDLILGGILAAIGVLILLQNLGIFGAASDMIWSLLFAVGGIAFFSAVVRNSAHWWALIPGAALFSIGVLIGVTALAPAFGAAWGGTIFLGGLGLGFLAVYLVRHPFWWALIPAGTLITLGLIAGVDRLVPDSIAGTVFFIGLALTFGLVAIAPPDAPRRWAFFPAGALLVLGVLTLANASMLFNILWPILLIGLGASLLYRAYLHNKRDHYEHDTVSQPH